MRLSLGLEARQVQVQKLAPRMIQSMEILQMPIMRLQEKIADAAQHRSPRGEIPSLVDQGSILVENLICYRGDDRKEVAQLVTCGTRGDVINGLG